MQVRKLTHAFLWEYSYKRLKLAQLLGQLGVFLTLAALTGGLRAGAHGLVLDLFRRQPPALGLGQGQGGAGGAERPLEN
jgi:hypothetical protein